jgi:long-chain acyl-CoA synthetase
MLPFAALNPTDTLHMDKIWLSSYPKGVPADIDVAELGTVSDLLEGTVQRYGQRRAFISGSTGVAITYAELDRLSRQLAAYFQSVLGLPAGTRVALMMPNLLQYPVCLFGLLRAGYVVVNVNPMYTPRELAHQLKDSGAKAIIVAELFAHTVQKAREGSALEHVVVTGMADMMPVVKRLLGNLLIRHVKRLVQPYELANSVGLRDALKQGARSRFEPVPLKPQDLAFLQYTGGTTGVSKGAMLTHLNVMANVKQTQVWSEPFLDPQADLISITAIPLNHIFALGSCLTFLGMGGTNVLVADPRNIPAFVAILRQYPFVSIPAVNTLFNGLVNAPDFAKADFSQLRLAIGGGAAVQRPVAERWQAITGTPLVEGYGLTECSPTVSANPFDLKTFNGSIGLPMPSTQVSIRNAAGLPCALGEAGELCVKGPQVMQGYWQRPQETAAVMTADGFLRTGDVATMDAAGFLKIVDRLKDMILVSGFNVYPNEIEEVVMMLPDVLEVAALGRASPSTGEQVVLFVVKKNEALTEARVLQHCRQQLTAYKVPQQVHFLGELPKSPVGKILRRELRERRDPGQPVASSTSNPRDTP